MGKLELEGRKREGMEAEGRVCVERMGRMEVEADSLFQQIRYVCVYMCVYSTLFMFVYVCEGMETCDWIRWDNYGPSSNFKQKSNE